MDANDTLKQRGIGLQRLFDLLQEVAGYLARQLLGSVYCNV